MNRAVFRISFFLTAIVIFLSTLFWAGGILPVSALWKVNPPLDLDHRILWSLRLPRLILVTGIGGSLAMLGAVYQVLFNNPLAEPYVLGISTAVTLGVVVSNFVWGAPQDSATALACGLIFSLVAVGLIIFSYIWKTGRNLERVILFGIGLNFVCSSLLFALVSYQHQNSGGSSLKWLFGNIPWVNAHHALLIITILFPICFLIVLMGRHLDALSLGDSVASTLGFSPTRSRLIILLLSSVLLAVIASISGAIGFVGLVVPHCIRLLQSPRSSRQLLLGSFLGGAVFLALSDSVSRSILPPLEFPIGIVTTILGGPIFLYLLWKK